MNSNLPYVFEPIKILIIEKNIALSQGLCEEIKQFGYQVIGANFKQQAIKEFELLKPDLIITDVNLAASFGQAIKAGSGVELAKELINRHPEIGLLFYTTEEKYINAAEEIYRSGKGGVGYISKESQISLSSFIPSILAGNWVCIITKPNSLSNITIEALLFGLSDTTKEIVLMAAANIQRLSKKEKETLSLLGNNNYFIAHTLGIRKNSVEVRIKNIYTKLGLINVDRRLRAMLADRAWSIYNRLYQT